jgi:ribosomal protein L11 methyltransferase
MTEHALVLKSMLALPDSLAEKLRDAGTTGIWEVAPGEWKAYFAAPDAALARSISRLHPAVTAAWESSESTDWAARYQASLKPIPVGRRFVVLPSPDLANPWPDRMPLCIVPGTAFGTGEHYTTSSCLRTLEELSRVPESVLDVGCGTGILAAAACKLGASRVKACDTDPEACRVAMETRAANGVFFDVILGSAREIEGRFRLLFANILAETLVEILPDLRSRTRSGGLLIGSGIATPKAKVVLEAAKKTGFKMLAIRGDGAWSTVLWKALNH